LNLTARFYLQGINLAGFHFKGGHVALKPSLKAWKQQVVLYRRGRTIENLLDW